jgi:hypothetical protein
MSEPRTWTLEYPAATPPLSSNRPVHWRAKHNEHRWWTSATEILLRQAHVPHLDRCSLELYVTPPNRLRRDSDNYVAHLLKPIKDGLVAAGVVDDDTDRYVIWRLELLEPVPNPLKAWRYRAVIRELAPVEVRT